MLGAFLGEYIGPELYDYQKWFLEKIKSLENDKSQSFPNGKNALIVLPTGTGKTVIAAKTIVAALQDPKNLEKVIFFVAPTKALVDQHANTLKNLISNTTIDFMHGGQSSDGWQSWKNFIETSKIYQNLDQLKKICLAQMQNLSNNPASLEKAITTDLTEEMWPSDQISRVCVTTPDMFLFQLNTGVIKYERIALLIFDEFHLFKDKSPYARIITNFYPRCSLENRPHILAMTASPLSTANEIVNFVTNSTDRLRIFTNAIISSSQDLDLEIILPHPDFLNIYHQNINTLTIMMDGNFLLTNHMLRLKERVFEPFLQAVDRTLSVLEDEPIILTAYDDLKTFWFTVTNVFESIARNYGMWAFVFTANFTMTKTLAINDFQKILGLLRLLFNIDTSDLADIQGLMRLLTTYKERVEEHVFTQSQEFIKLINEWKIDTFGDNMEHDLQTLPLKQLLHKSYISENLYILLKSIIQPFYLYKHFVENFPFSNICPYCGKTLQQLVNKKDFLYHYKFHCTHTKAIIFCNARNTCIMVDDLLKRRNWNFSHYCTGTHPRHTLIKSPAQKTSSFQATIMRFKQVDSGLDCLVATNVLKEGIDLPECNLVIRLDRFMDPTEFIQSKGRARKTTSLFVNIIETQKQKQLIMYLDKYQEAIRDFANYTHIMTSKLPSLKKLKDYTPFPVYRPKTGAIITMYDATSFLFSLYQRHDPVSGKLLCFCHPPFSFAQYVTNQHTLEPHCARITLPKIKMYGKTYVDKNTTIDVYIPPEFQNKQSKRHFISLEAIRFLNNLDPPIFDDNFNLRYEKKKKEACKVEERTEIVFRKVPDCLIKVAQNNFLGEEEGVKIQEQNDKINTPLEGVDTPLIGTQNTYYIYKLVMNKESFSSYLTTCNEDVLTNTHKSTNSSQESHMHTNTHHANTHSNQHNLNTQKHTYSNTHTTTYTQKNTYSSTYTHTNPNSNTYSDNPFLNTHTQTNTHTYTPSNPPSNPLTNTQLPSHTNTHSNMHSKVDTENLNIHMKRGNIDNKCTYQNDNKIKEMLNKYEDNINKIGEIGLLFSTKFDANFSSNYNFFSSVTYADVPTKDAFFAHQFALISNIFYIQPILLTSDQVNIIKDFSSIVFKAFKHLPHFNIGDENCQMALPFILSDFNEPDFDFMKNVITLLPYQMNQMYVQPKNINLNQDTSEKKDINPDNPSSVNETQNTSMEASHIIMKGGKKAKFTSTIDEGEDRLWMNMEMLKRDKICNNLSIEKHTAYNLMKIHMQNDIFNGYKNVVYKGIETIDKKPFYPIHRLLLATPQSTPNIYQTVPFSQHTFGYINARDPHDLCASESTRVIKLSSDGIYPFVLDLSSCLCMYGYHYLCYNMEGMLLTLELMSDLKRGISEALSSLEPFVGSSVYTHIFEEIYPIKIDPILLQTSLTSTSVYKTAYSSQFPPLTGFEEEYGIYRGHIISYQRLEFLGDAILSFIIRFYHFFNESAKDEQSAQSLSESSAYYESNQTLYIHSKRLKLPIYSTLNNYSPKLPLSKLRIGLISNKQTSDLFEAVLAAIYLSNQDNYLLLTHEQAYNQHLNNYIKPPIQTHSILPTSHTKLYTLGQPIFPPLTNANQTHNKHTNSPHNTPPDTLINTHSDNHYTPSHTHDTLSNNHYTSSNNHYTNSNNHNTPPHTHSKPPYIHDTSSNTHFTSSDTHSTSSKSPSLEKKLTVEGEEGRLSIGKYEGIERGNVEDKGCSIRCEIGGRSRVEEEENSMKNTSDINIDNPLKMDGEGNKYSVVTLLPSICNDSNNRNKMEAFKKGDLNKGNDNKNIFYRCEEVCYNNDDFYKYSKEELLTYKVLIVKEEKNRETMNLFTLLTLIERPTKMTKIIEKEEGILIPTVKEILQNTDNKINKNFSEHTPPPPPDNNKYLIPIPLLPTNTIPNKSLGFSSTEKGVLTAFLTLSHMLEKDFLSEIINNLHIYKLNTSFTINNKHTQALDNTQIMDMWSIYFQDTSLLSIIRQKSRFQDTLEFLGDSILKFMITEWLYINFPSFKVGALSTFKNILTSNCFFETIVLHMLSKYSGGVYTFDDIIIPNEENERSNKHSFINKETDASSHTDILIDKKTSTQIDNNNNNETKNKQQTNKSEQIFTFDLETIDLDEPLQCNRKEIADFYETLVGAYFLDTIMTTHQFNLQAVWNAFGEPFKLMHTPIKNVYISRNLFTS